MSRKLLSAPKTPELRAALLQELTLQVERALGAGIPVSHFDSHQHVHTLPLVFPILKSLQRKFGIRKVRPTINLLPGSGRMGPGRRLKKALFRAALQHIYATKSPEGLGDFRDFHAALKSGRMPRFRTLELMVHPGATTSRYYEEIDLLRSDWRGMLPQDVEMGCYHSI